MEVEKALDLLEGLLDNAVEMNEKEYAESFSMAMNAICEADSLMKMMKIEEKLLIEEFGNEWYAKHAQRVASECFKANVNEMPDSEFKQFVVSHMDEITGGCFEDVRLP